MPKLRRDLSMVYVLSIPCLDEQVGHQSIGHNTNTVLGFFSVSGMSLSGCALYATYSNDLSLQCLRYPLCISSWTELQWSWTEIWFIILYGIGLKNWGTQLGRVFFFIALDSTTLSKLSWRDAAAAFLKREILNCISPTVPELMKPSRCCVNYIIITCVLFTPFVLEIYKS